MTRRDVIKSGAGLAAILAAGRAPAALVKSMLGVRMTIASGKWNNPYVTDGLVAMWDGEWNAGPGKHDAHATTWKNLVTGDDDITLNNLTFDVNSLVGVMSTASYGTVPSTFDSVETIEVCFKKNAVDSSTKYPWCAFLTRGKGFASTQYFGNIRVTFLSYSGWTNMPGVTDMSSDIRHYTLVGNPSAEYSFYKNGALQANATVYGYLYNARANSVCYNMAGNIYNIRLYSRALTAAEVAANYAIDQRRFNIS